MKSVDDESWKSMIADFQSSYAELRETISQRAGDNAQAFGVSTAAGAHVAYHQAAILQKLAVLRSK